MKKLHFDVNGCPYWDGRHLTAENYEEVLEAFDTIISRQLWAWVERHMRRQRTGRLDDSGVLAQMAGLEPLHKLLATIEGALKPESDYDDRLDRIPERPREPVMPKRLCLPDSIQTREIERRQQRIALQHFDLQKSLWEMDIASWPERERHFRERLARNGEYQEWKRVRQAVHSARERLTVWEQRLNECLTDRRWEFFPPGPGMQYTLEWVKSRLEKRSPGDEYDFERIAVMLEFQPRMLCFGSVDFSVDYKRYVAFIFENDYAALESPKVGNALYLLRRDWRILSRKPKQELRHMKKEGDWRIDHKNHTKDRDLKPMLAAELRLYA
jgi:hypothetical protein